MAYSVLHPKDIFDELGDLPQPAALHERQVYCQVRNPVHRRRLSTAVAARGARIAGAASAGALAASKRECCWSRVPAFAGARHLKGRRHLLPLVLRRQARWTRSTPGALLERPAPPCKPFSHPAPTPRTSSAALHRPRIVCTPRSRLTPRCARAQELDFAELDFALLHRPESRVARHGGAVAARQRRHGPRGPCGSSGAQGAVKKVGAVAPCQGGRLGAETGRLRFFWQLQLAPFVYVVLAVLR